MKLDETLKMLAARFGMPLSEEEVMKRVLAELEAGTGAKDAVTKLLALLEDSKTLEAASAKLAEYKAALAEFEQVLPELKAMADNTSAVEDEQAVTDVAQAMQAIRSSDERVRGALLTQRTNSTDLKALAAALKGEKVLSKFVSWFLLYGAAYGKRLEARDAFRKQYAPPDAKGPEPSYLTRSLTNPESQVQSPFLRALTADANGVRSSGVPVTSEPRLGEGEGGLLAEIEKCNGVNITEKAMSYVGAQPGGNKLSFERCHEEACKLLQRARNGSR